VECWVNLSELAWNQFAGNRGNAREIYPAKGWALGMGNEGIIRFTVDDGDKTICVSVNSVMTDWEPSGWNYIVGVRDKLDGVIALYVNGEEATRKKDATKNLSNANSIVMGYDAMGGAYMNGDMDELKITKKALSKEEIFNRFSRLVIK